MKWSCAAAHGPDIISRLLKEGWPDDVLMNVNFPNLEPEGVTGVVVTEQGIWDQSHTYIDARVDVRGNEYFWLGYKHRAGDNLKGSDVYAINHGQISITPLHLNLTHRPTHEKLKSAFQDSESR